MYRELTGAGMDCCSVQGAEGSRNELPNNLAKFKRIHVFNDKQSLMLNHI